MIILSRYYPNRAIEGKAVVYFLNTSCNRSCSQCYLRNTAGPDRDLQKASDNVTQLLRQGFEVIPAGAEVLLNPDYLEIYRIAKRKYIRSNGTPIANNPELADRIIEYSIDNVLFTLNTDPDNDVLGLTPQEVIEQAIKISLNSGLNVCGSVVITNQNYRNLNQITNDAIDLGVTVLDFINLIPTNSSLNQFVLNESEIKSFFNQITQLKNSIPIETLYLTASPTFGINLRPNKAELLQNEKCCSAGDKFMVIGIDDVVYPCTFLMREEYAIGEFDNGIIRLYDNTGELKQKNRLDCLARREWGGKE